jgi:hypothetical protein
MAVPDGLEKCRERGERFSMIVRQCMRPRPRVFARKQARHKKVGLSMSA